MTRLTRLEVNCTTGEEKIIELTDEELAQLEITRAKDEADRATREAEAEAKAAAKAAGQAKLAALGLTAEEIAAL
jgi:hypothetical protein